jgi:hypothetical protein
MWPCADLAPSRTTAEVPSQAWSPSSEDLAPASAADEDLEDNMMSEDGAMPDAQALEAAGFRVVSNKDVPTVSAGGKTTGAAFVLSYSFETAAPCAEICAGLSNCAFAIWQGANPAWTGENNCFLKMFKDAKLVDCSVPQDAQLASNVYIFIKLSDECVPLSCPSGCVLVACSCHGINIEAASAVPFPHVSFAQLCIMCTATI